MGLLNLRVKIPQIWHLCVKRAWKPEILRDSRRLKKENSILEGLKLTDISTLFSYTGGSWFQLSTLLPYAKICTFHSPNQYTRKLQKGHQMLLLQVTASKAWGRLKISSATFAEELCRWWSLRTGIWVVGERQFLLLDPLVSNDLQEWSEERRCYIGVSHPLVIKVEAAKQSLLGS